MQVDDYNNNNDYHICPKCRTGELVKATKKLYKGYYLAFVCRKCNFTKVIESLDPGEWLT